MRDYPCQSTVESRPFRVFSRRSLQTRPARFPKTWQVCYLFTGGIMRIFDISVPLAAGLPTWPGDPCFQLEPVLLLEQGDEARVARLTLGDHSGTHLDAPAHMLADGSNLDSFSPSLLMGPALVADLRGVTEIGVQELAGLPLAGVERLLLKTDNSRLWDRAEFCREFVALSAAGAELLVSKGIRLVGIEFLSIERFGGDGSVHHILLGN
ncbi:MAG: cyclase family protein, partial [Geobacteraceae bacterium]|nr:cyclase family protein [Geobacteraceae bacterium]